MLFHGGEVHLEGVMEDTGPSTQLIAKHSRRPPKSNSSPNSASGVEDEEEKHARP